MKAFKHPVVITILVLNIFLVSLGAYYSFTDQDLLTRFTKEDGFIEWLQFLLFTYASIFMFFVTYEKARQGESLLSLQLLGPLAMGFVFMLGALEEISWYQRIADVQSSDFFIKHNRQGETNLHNMEVGGVGINKLVFGKLLFVALITHNVFLPLIAKKKPKLREWVESKGAFLPPLRLVAIYLLFAVLIELLVSHSREKEILEYIGAVHYLSAIFMTYGLGIGYAKPLLTNAEEKRRLTILYCISLFFLTYVAWILGNMSIKTFML